MKDYQYNYAMTKHGTHYEYDPCLLAMKAYKLPYRPVPLSHKG